jgi:predicted Zn-dependent peptidase
MVTVTRSRWKLIAEPDLAHRARLVARVPFVHRTGRPWTRIRLLTGRTGRLYKTLVLGRQIANQVEASVDLRKYAGAFEVECVVKEGKDPSDVEAAIHEEIRRLRDEPVPAEEMQKVKNQGKASAYRRLSSPFSIAIQLLYYDGLGDWKYINSYADEVDAVTAADIQRVARTYFTKENRTVGVFLRKEAAASPAPPAAPGEGAR